jgi:hypothetical protein
MRIRVEVEKAGEVIVRTTAESKPEDDIMKTLRRAFARLVRKNPDLSLLDEDVCVKFTNAPTGKKNKAKK